jgi:glycosyltransferase involved in cell wall biosynthesis
MIAKAKNRAENALPAMSRAQKLLPGFNGRTLFPRQFRRRNARFAKDKPMISVIVPAHNEERYLRETLRSLEQQRYSRYEVIVVANGCSDATAAVARKHCDRLIVISQKGISLSRNLGARMARGDILVFVDADTILQPDALKIISRQFTPEYAAGTLRAKPEPARWFYLLLYFFKNLMHWSRLHKGSVGVILCWKKHFEAEGGFDEGLHVMENSALIEKLQKHGKYRFVNNTIATTSMRRYEKKGFRRTVGLWVKLWLRSLTGDLHHRGYETVR